MGHMRPQVEALVRIAVHADGGACPPDDYKRLLTGQKYRVYCGLLGRIAEIAAFSIKIDAEDFATCLRHEFPDHRAVFWVSDARVRYNTNWLSVRDRLCKSDGETGIPTPALLHDLENSRRRFARSRKRDNTKERMQGTVTYRINSVLSGRCTDGGLGILPYKVGDLMDHLSSRFLPGMSWQNWGRSQRDIKTWQIDHIKPCALFDFNDSEQIRLCWALSNIQPLWARDNILKRDRY